MLTCPKLALWKREDEMPQHKPHNCESLLHTPLANTNCMQMKIEEMLTEEKMNDPWYWRQEEDL